MFNYGKLGNFRPAKLTPYMVCVSLFYPVNSHNAIA